MSNPAAGSPSKNTPVFLGVATAVLFYLLFLGAYCLGVKFSRGPIFVVGLAWFLGLIVFPILPAFLAVEARVSERRREIARGQFSFFLALGLSLWAMQLTFGPAKAGWIYYRSELRAFAERSRPIIDAIHAYEAATGDPPYDLKMLVPKYIPAIPATGMGDWKYQYGRNAVSSAKEQAVKGRTTWNLRIGAGFSLSFDSFFYSEDKDYLARFTPAELEPIGDWYYHHE